jgi:hypothetical protein
MSDMAQSGAKGLEFHGKLPLAVHAVAALPDAHELLVINHGNEQVLRSVMMLEEKPDHDDSDPIHQELKRQDQKLNLVLDLLSTLLVRFNAVPAARELQLTDTALSFVDPAPGLQGLCEMQLYIEPSLPRPLRLFGSALFDQASGSTIISFQGLSRALVDQLDKYIFRYHRRLVALAVAEKQAG